MILVIFNENIFILFSKIFDCADFDRTFIASIGKILSVIELLRNRKIPPFSSEPSINIFFLIYNK